MPGYYVTIAGKQYDRALYEAALDAVKGQGDGRISAADAEKLVRRVLDAGPGDADVYTPVEKRTVQLIRATMRWTAAGDRGFRKAIRSAAARRSWEVRAQPSPTPAPGGVVSGLFPRDSRFGKPLEGAYMPPETDRGDIEEEAHVLNYTTAAGRYCELWWVGGDGGTPLLAYLVDDAGPHYLPELSQPKLTGDPAWGSLLEAKDRFVGLAEAFYPA